MLDERLPESVAIDLSRRERCLSLKFCCDPEPDLTLARNTRCLAAGMEAAMPDRLREELVEASKNLRRQLEILQSPPVITGKGGPPDNRALIAELQDQLRQIDEAIANLD